MTRHPTLLRGTQLIFQTDFTSQGGTPLYDCHEWVSIEWQESLSAKGRGYARVILPADAVAAEHARITNVLRINQQRLSDAGGYDSYEFRIMELDDSVGTDLVVTAQPFITEFGRVQIRSVAGGVPSKTVVISQLTPTQILADIIIPTMEDEGVLGLELGDVLATGRLVATLENMTPLALLEWLEQQTGFDAYVTRDSETVRSLHLATLGAGIPAPAIIVGRNAIALDRAIVADDQFATRVEASGAQRPGDEQPSHAGQATWDAVAIPGVGTYALADPAGGPGPIGAVDQVVGNTALIGLDPVMWPQGSKAVGSVGVDSQRHIVWQSQAGGGAGMDTLLWYDLTTGAYGSLTIAGSPALGMLAYAVSVDRLYVASDIGLIVINPATKAHVSTITIAGTPRTIEYIGAKSYLVVLYADSTHNVQIVDVTTNTVTNTITSTETLSLVVFDQPSNRLFFCIQGHTIIAAYNATTFASVGNVAVDEGVMQISSPSVSFPYMLVVSAARHYAWVNPATLTASSFMALNLAGAPTIIYGHAPTLGTYIYFLSTQFIYSFNGTTVTGVGDLPNAVTACYNIEPTEWSAAAYLFSFDSVVNAVRRIRCGLPAPVPFEQATITACDIDAQTVTLDPAPLYLTADARLQIREDASLTYLTRLTDPDAVDTYGKVDAAPKYDAVGLANYWRGGRMADWRADGTLRALGMVGITLGQERTHRWSRPDYVGGANIVCATAGPYVAGDLTLSVTGLTAGRVIMPGDRFATSPTLMTAPHGYVRYRAVANGVGTVTVSITPGSLGSMGTGATLYLSTPAFTLSEARPDGVVVMPVNPMNTWATATAVVPVPHVTGDSVAWVVAHLQLWCVSFRPDHAFLRVTAPFGGIAQYVRPADTATITTGEVRDYWLAKRVDLTSAKPGSIMVEVGASGGVGTSTGTILVRSLAVILSPGSTAEGTAIDVFGDEGANVLWQLSNIRLAQGRDPSVNYRVEALEDGDAYQLGINVMVVDPVRAIATQPRIISVTRYGSGPDQLLRKPVIEVSSANFSLLRAVVALQQNVVTTVSR